MIVVSKNPLILFANNSHPALKEDINSHDNNTELRADCRTMEAAVDEKKWEIINITEE